MFLIHDWIMVNSIVFFLVLVRFIIIIFSIYK